jgi:hypothetical protein
MIDATCDTEQLIQNIDATCAIEEFTQMVDATCDKNEIMQNIDATCDTQDIIQMSDATFDKEDLIANAQDTEDMEYSMQLMEEIFVKDKSQEEAYNGSSRKKCEEAKEQQNSIFPRWFSYLRRTYR